MSIKLRRDGLVLHTAWYYRAGRLLIRTAILGMLLVLIVRAAEYLGYAARAITFPFELEYAEGIVWQQALLIPGPRMYGDITQFPFLVFHYTPVYHLVVRALATLGIDPLAAGRGTTAAATIAIAILAGAISSTAMRKIVPTNARIIGATLSSLMVFTYHPVQEWAVTMRVDMLAIAFSIAGVYLAILAGHEDTYFMCGNSHVRTRGLHKADGAFRSNGSRACRDRGQRALGTNSVGVWAPHRGRGLHHLGTEHWRRILASCF